MRTLKKDLKNNFVQLQADSPEDLWLLSWLLSPNDEVRGATERKIKIGGEDARNQKVIRKKMTLTIKAEKITYEHDTLRVLGTILQGPDDVARGDHHSIIFNESDKIGITKTRGWAAWELERIKEACAQKAENILAVLYDRENAIFAQLDGKGYTIISTIQGVVAKKDQEGQGKGNFFKDVAVQLAEYNRRYQPRSIIAASPAFFKDYLKKTIGEEENKKVIYATVSDASEQSIGELLRRPELKNALEADRSAQEEQYVDKLLLAIAKEQSSYGVKDVQGRANEGNIKQLYITINKLQEAREAGEWEKYDNIMKTTEQANGNIIIITTKEASKQVDGLGGIAGIRRW